MTTINHRRHFSGQAQSLVKLECHFPWQARHFLKFWEIAGAPNVVIFHAKKMRRQDGTGKLSEAAGAR